MTKNDLLIIVPAYNESENIVGVMEQLEAPQITSFADVLFINDASNDNTNYLVKSRHHTLVSHIFNMGYGTSLQLGYKYAIRRGYKYVIQMDADGQHDVVNIARIYKELKTPDEHGIMPDIVLGSRYLEGSSPFPTPRLKMFAIRLFRRIVKALTGKVVMDPTSGLQGLSQRAFLYYSMFNHFDERYPDANMLIKMLLLEFQVREIPAVMHARQSGSSMHNGLKPAMYMVRMLFEIMAVTFEYKIRKVDKGAGHNDTIWKEKKGE